MVKAEIPNIFFPLFSLLKTIEKGSLKARKPE
jgi:hypothetical protein